MNEEILKNIWDVLSSEGATESDFETWKSNFAGDEEIQTNVHEYLIDGGYTENDWGTWSTNVGLKKKGEGMALPSADGSLVSSETEFVQPIETFDIGSESTEKDTAIERIFGKNVVTDLFGDLYRAGAAGQAQGGWHTGQQGTHG